MEIRTGLGTQFGIGAEVTYGTEVTPTDFIYFDDESLKAEQGEIRSNFLGAGLTLQTSQVSVYVSGGGGDITHPFFNKGMKKLLKAAFGAVADAQVSATAEYTHTYTVDKTNGRVGQGFSLQVLKPNTVGSLVNPFTAAGGKVTSWEISMSDKGLLMLKLSWITADGDFATSLASPSYPTNLMMFNWSNASITLDGNDFFAKSFSLKGAYALDTDRRGLSQTNRREPLPNDSPGVSITGQMAGEFEDLTAWDMFVAGSFQPLVITADSGASLIPTTSNPYKVVITLPAVRLTGDTPTVGGPGVLEMPAAFEAADNATDPIISLVTHNDETAG